MDKIIVYNTKRALKDKGPYTFFIFFIIVALNSLAMVIIDTVVSLVSSGEIVSKYFDSYFFGFISYFEMMVVVVVAVVCIFVIAPFFYGIINWSANTAEGVHDDFKSFFCCFMEKKKYVNAILLLLTNVVISVAIYYLLFKTTIVMFEISIENNILSPNSEMAAAAFLSAAVGTFFGVISALAIVFFLATSVVTVYLSTMQNYSGIMAAMRRAIKLLQRDKFILIRNIFLFLLLWILTFFFFPFFLFAFYYSVKLAIAIKVLDKKLDTDNLFK